MIKLIVGKKGSGKTKTLIDMTNSAVKISSGNVICIEKGPKLTHDIDHSARLVNTDEYKLEGFDALYGFITGMLAGNYDITHIFVDGTLTIGNGDIPKFASMIDSLSQIKGVQYLEYIAFTVSCDKSELPEALIQYVI